MKISTHGDYTVFEWKDESNSFHMEELLSFSPKIVEGNYIAITSWDSGIFQPNKSELAAGWRLVGQIAYSPRISDWKTLPYETYDEWFVFAEPTILTDGEPMVTYMGFSPAEFSWREKLDSFWARVHEHRPMHVIGDGQHLFLITRDPRTIEIIAEPCAPTYAKRAARR